MAARAGYTGPRFGAGRIGTGFNLVVGPLELQVEEADAERARDVLAAMPLPSSEAEAEAAASASEPSASDLGEN